MVQTRGQKKAADILAARNNNTAASTTAAAASTAANPPNVPATLPSVNTGKRRASDSASSDKEAKRARRHSSPDHPAEQTHQPSIDQEAGLSRKRASPVDDDADAVASVRPTKKTRSNPSTEKPNATPKRQPRRRKEKEPREPATTPDGKFLEQAIAQFKVLKPARGTIRQAQVSLIVPILEAMRTPKDDNVRTSFDADADADEQDNAPDAYYLSSEDAKRFLNSDQAIAVPVFVADGAARIFDDPSDTRRPIEQALTDWCVDPLEDQTYFDPTNKKHELTVITLAKVRSHFLNPTAAEASVSDASSAGPSSAPQPSTTETSDLNPWNFPDIVNPQAAQSIPPFLRSAQCNLLHDLMRFILLIEGDDICYPGCPTIADHTTTTGPCEKHQISLMEMNLLHMMYTYWRGTLMISDPGTVSVAHFDKWSLGTFISIYEGEVGLAWLTYPSTEEQMACCNDQKRIPERALLKVMRKGDAVYMPPGTVHTVVRLPGEGGAQTMGVAGHVLRRGANLDQWLEMMGREMQNVVDNPYKFDSQAIVVPPLVKGVEKFLDRLGSEKDREKLGGEEVIERARKAIEVLVGLFPALAKLQGRKEAEAAAAQKKADAAEEKKQAAAEKKEAKSKTKNVATAGAESGAEDQIETTAGETMAGSSRNEPAVGDPAEETAAEEPVVDDSATEQPETQRPTVDQPQQQESTSKETGEEEEATSGALSTAPGDVAYAAQPPPPAVEPTQAATVPSGWLELLGQGPSTP